MNYIEEQLQLFDNEFGLSGLFSHPLEYSDMERDEYDRVKSFLTQSLQGMKDRFRNIELAPDQKTIDAIYKTSGRAEAFGMGQGWMCKKIDEIIDNL